MNLASQTHRCDLAVKILTSISVVTPVLVAKMAVVALD